jgi:two-component system chemotaxis response regulator CheY
VRILVVDSDPRTRDLIRRAVRRDLQGTTVDTESSFDALQLLEKEGFDLAIIELDLPVMNGIRLLEIVRGSSEIGSLPVVILAARASEATVRALLDLRVTGVLTKPLDPAMLSKRLVQWSQVVPATRVAHREADAQWIETILVADGDPHFRHFATDALRGGRRIVQASTGATAMKLALLHRPLTALVGQNLGLLSADMLVSELRRIPSLGSMRIVAVMPKNASASFSAKGYDGVVIRTFVPDVFRKEVAAISRPIGPMTKLLATYPMLTADLSTAVAQVCGMMLQIEVDRVPSLDFGTDATIRSSQPVTLTDRGLVFQFEVESTVPDAAQMTAKMTGEDSKQVSSESACATIAELTNIITGRLRNSMSEAGIAVHCDLPTTRAVPSSAHVDEPGEDESRLCFATGEGAPALQVSIVASAVDQELPVAS